MRSRIRDVINQTKIKSGCKSRSPVRTQPGKNIREGSNPRRPFFTREQNDLFVQLVLQYSQKKKIDELHYHVLGLDKSLTEDDIEKS